MNKEKRRVPKLRFPGFTEDWEQRKLSDILKVNSGKDYKHLDQGNIPVYGTGGYMLSVNESLSNIDAIGIGRKGTIDKPQYLKAPFWTVDTLFYLTALDKHSILFLYYLMQLIPWKKFDESTGVPSLSKTTIDNISGFVPSNSQEEELISALFNQLDKSITLHLRKLDNLKLKKKALLQKLFPKNGERYPELRFPGFTDAWEQRELCQITTRVTRKNGGQSDLPLTISAQDGLVDQRKYFNRQVASRDMSNYYLIKKGEFAYNKSYSEGYPFGAVKRLDYYDIGALSTLYILFEITDNNISSDFIVSYYMTHLWYKEISKRAAEGARNHGLLNISTEDFFDSELNIPNSIEEQVKIGNFIKQLDKFITLHQRKLDHLQLQKKALLQQMFV